MIRLKRFGETTTLLESGDGLLGATEELEGIQDDPAALWVMARTTNYWSILEKIARRPELEGDTLHWMWTERLGEKHDRNGDWTLVFLIAEHPNTDAETLLSIAEGAPDWLLEKLKENPNWPEDTTDWALSDW